MTVYDINPVLINLVPAQNLTVYQADIRTDRVARGSVRPRLVPRVPAPNRRPRVGVLERMAAAVRPGGWLSFKSLISASPDNRT